MKLLLMFALFMQGNEAALRARIVELEAQVKQLEARVTPPASATEWKAVASWKGLGAKTTESFQIKSSEWRVRWKASRSGPVGLFSVTAQSATDKLISTLVANTQEPGSDVSYVHGKQGRFYIEVTAAAMNWEITVEEK